MPGTGMRGALEAIRENGDARKSTTKKRFFRFHLTGGQGTSDKIYIVDWKVEIEYHNNSG